MDADDRLLASRLADIKNQDLQSAHESLGSFKYEKSTVDDRKFFCQICLEGCAISRGYTLNCGHTYCRGCLFRYLEVKIRDGIIQPKCFHPLGYKNHCRDILRERRDENDDERCLPGLYQNHDMEISNLQWKEVNNDAPNEQIDKNFKFDFVFDGKRKEEKTSNEENSIEEIRGGTMKGSSSKSILDIIPEKNSSYGLNILEFHSSRSESSLTLDQSSLSMGIDQNDGRTMLRESEVDVEEWNRQRGISIKPGSKLGLHMIGDNGNIDDDKDTIDNYDNEIISTDHDNNNGSIIYDENNDFHHKNDDANNSNNNTLSSASSIRLCDAIISTKEISKIISISPDLVKKFEFFKFTKENIDGRECPHCSNLQICSPLNPSIICGNCGDFFCFYHSKAHPNMTCEEVNFCLILISL